MHAAISSPASLLCSHKPAEELLESVLYTFKDGFKKALIIVNSFAKRIKIEGESRVGYQLLEVEFVSSYSMRKDSSVIYNKHLLKDVDLELDLLSCTDKGFCNAL